MSKDKPRRWFLYQQGRYFWTEEGHEALAKRQGEGVKMIVTHGHYKDRAAAERALEGKLKMVRAERHPEKGK